MSGAILSLPLHAAKKRIGTNICFLLKNRSGPYTGRLGCELNLSIYHSLL